MIIHGSEENTLKNIITPWDDRVKDNLINPEEILKNVKINEILEVYVPIYESRLIGPKKKIKLLRIDAVRKKIL